VALVLTCVVVMQLLPYVEMASEELPPKIGKTWVGLNLAWVGLNLAWGRLELVLGQI
jgi:hypothetical protein